jgi:hypothetical protein
MRHEQGEPMPAQVSPSIVQRFSQFISYIKSPTMTREGLAQNYGDTYWCYYFTNIQR